MRSFRLPGQDYGSPGLGYDPSREEHVVVCLGYTRLCLVTGEYAMECAVWPLRDLRPRTLASPPPIPVAVYLPPVHVGGKMYWPGISGSGAAADAAAILVFDISTETFEVVPAPPVLLDADGGDRMILAELAGKLCAVHLSVNTETMTVWSKSAEGWRENVIELGQWPEFSPRTTELVMPMAVDPMDGQILLDTGKALGYYGTRSRSLETVYSLKSQQIGDGDNGDDMLFIATVCEDSLLRPYDRMDRVR
ncbi:hypothetical protein C2845_PM05G01450 [Panicum miliaceum]|uniref:F-box associated beta-propeller type 3 domain-containing protein n=1 Tax=Panicum miliaceum TaxID=4540 RepID=A0A3L6T2I8_PANMI|nr:hypothetical protein C2845_PM05G01450 [Panicum miliaceum]